MDGGPLEEKVECLVFLTGFSTTGGWSWECWGNHDWGCHGFARHPLHDEGEGDPRVHLERANRFNK